MMYTASRTKYKKSRQKKKKCFMRTLEYVCTQGNSVPSFSFFLGGGGDPTLFFSRWDANSAGSSAWANGNWRAVLYESLAWATTKVLLHAFGRTPYPLIEAEKRGGGKKCPTRRNISPFFIWKRRKQKTKDATWIAIDVTFFIGESLSPSIDVNSTHLNVPTVQWEH